MYSGSWMEADFRYQQLLEEAERVRQAKRVKRENKQTEREQQTPRRILNILF